jgi:periplasmic protein TonB
LNAGVLLNFPSTIISLLAPEASRSLSDHNLPLQQKSQVDLTQFEGIQLKRVKKASSISSSRLKLFGFVLAISGHAAILFLLLGNVHPPKLLEQASTPITVSIIAPPSPDPVPEPAIVPIIKPIKEIKKPVIKPKKVVEKIVPVENPIQQVIEAVTEPVVEEQQLEEEIATPIVEQKSASQPANVEEKIEQPKFGVAYLNNPSPSYPRLSRRIGEEGRVLLKVLVSAEGKANTVEIEKSSGFQRLDQSALDAVKQWRFIPARKGKESLSAYVLVPISFSLESQ